MARSPEIDHLENAINQIQKVLNHAPFTPVETQEGEAETQELRPEAPSA